MAIDRVGNTLKQAKELTFSSRSTSFKDQIGGRDTNDFFRFRLNNRSSVDFSFKGSKANLQLLNGKGQPLQASKPQGKILSINTSLNAGTYCIRVSSPVKKATNYVLRASVSLAQPMTSNDSNALAAIAYPTSQPSSQSAQFTQAGLDDGSVIDIMIAYTADARTAEGGTDAIQKTIQAAVDEVNQGYANSGIIQRLRLVRTTEVNYTESGNSNTDLTRLQSKTDGYMDDIHALRDQCGADIVSLFVKNSNSGGTSYTMNQYTMNQVTPEFEAYAFNVVQIDNVKTRFSLGHEIGHNLGAAHDRAHVDSDAISPYAYGCITSSGVGDIMSYAKDRRNYYSSPNITINGEALGKAGEADVVTTFNEVRFTAANWRKSVVN